MAMPEARPRFPKDSVQLKDGHLQFARGTAENVCQDAMKCEALCIIETCVSRRLQCSAEKKP